MTDDKGLVDAYASIYEHHQKDADGNVIEHEEDKKEQIDEALPALAMPLLKFAGKKLLQFGANKLKQKAIGAVGNMMRGGGPSTQAHRQNKMGMQPAMASYQPEMDMVEDVAITHLDGSTTEVIDVVKPEPIGDPDARLADRLWDQVASNLTTLGEMGDTRYRVEPVEEGKKAKKDYDGDGKVESGAKEYRGVIHNKIQQAKGGKGDGKDTSSVEENFNVKSPVIFSKPEPKTEESITEDMVKKHASSILKAHKAMTEGKNGGDNDPCWDSHKQVGMKKKGGKMVPNCVPK